MPFKHARNVRLPHSQHALVISTATTCKLSVSHDSVLIAVFVFLLAISKSFIEGNRSKISCISILAGVSIFTAAVYNSVC